MSDLPANAPDFRMKAIALLSAGLLALPALGAAQDSQLQSVLQTVALGAGPQSFGPTPGRTFNALYGTVDLAVNYTHAGGRSEVRVQSGNAWTSKFGFYGQEDLGGRWTGLYRLESGFYANNGTQQDAKTLFNRGSFVGLQNPSYGQVTVGRQYTSMGSAALGADPFLVTAHDSVTTYLMTASGLATGASNDALARLNDTVRYVTPRSSSGFGGDFSYSLKSDQSQGRGTHARTAVLSYADHSMIATASYGQAWCDPGTTTCTSNGVSTAGVRTDVMSTSVLSDLGPFVAQAAYFHFAPKAVGADTANLYLLGAQRMADGNLYRLSVGYRSTSIADDHAYGATVGMDHFLSKRTAIYARVGFLRNSDRSSISYNYDSTSSDTALTAGQSAHDITIGMYQNF